MKASKSVAGPRLSACCLAETARITLMHPASRRRIILNHVDEINSLVVAKYSRPFP
jgi:hypothetical protein